MSLSALGLSATIHITKSGVKSKRDLPYWSLSATTEGWGLIWHASDLHPFTGQK